MVRGTCQSVERAVGTRRRLWLGDGCGGCVVVIVVVVVVVVVWWWLCDCGGGCVIVVAVVGVHFNHFVEQGV